MTASVSPHPRNCATCGAQFQPASNRQKYCTSCGRRPKATCEVCGETFAVNSSATGRWCSLRCAGIGRRGTDFQPRPCEQCGNTFLPKVAWRRFCSVACSNANSKHPPRTCPVCDREFRSRHRSATCSRACAATFRRKYPDGRPCDRCGGLIPYPDAAFRRFCSMECRKTPVGTRQLTDQGYVRLMTEDGWVAEHRHVMAQTLGRPLDPRDRVHHKDGNRANNDPSNLELWRLRKDPSGVRAADYHCPGCRCAESPMG